MYILITYSFILFTCFQTVFCQTLSKYKQAHGKQYYYLIKNNEYKIIKMNKLQKAILLFHKRLSIIYF